MVRRIIPEWHMIGSEIGNSDKDGIEFITPSRNWKSYINGPALEQMKKDLGMTSAQEIPLRIKEVVNYFVSQSQYVEFEDIPNSIIPKSIK